MLAIVGREGRSAVFGLPPKAQPLEDPAGRLVRVDLDGTRAWALAEDEPELAGEPQAEGVRLLPNLDPLNAGRDRDLLVSDPAVRKRIWQAIGGPGVVLVSGEEAAEAQRIAPFRGADNGEVRTATL